MSNNSEVCASKPNTQVGAKAYERPSIRQLDEDELLNAFQMTAAEISVAACWWGNCPSAACP